MARKFIWNVIKYAEEVRRLRPIMRGFEARNDFNLREVSTWSRGQKQKIRNAFKRVQVLQAQARVPMKAPAKDLRQLQKAFHGGIQSKDLKVVFTPSVRPKFALDESKKAKPRVYIRDDIVWVKEAGYERALVEFDHQQLAKDARAEIARANEQMGGADLYFVQTEMYQSVNGRNLASVMTLITKWMHQYDGKRALPSGSGNSGDDPKHHHWSMWLKGLVGYRLGGKRTPHQMAVLIDKGRQDNERMKAERNRRMRREGAKGWKNGKGKGKKK